MARAQMDLKRQKVKILGVSVDDLTPDEAIKRVFSLSKDKEKSHYAVTVNSEFIMLARRNREFLNILNEADLALADGAFVVFSKLIFGGKFQSRITGVDLINRICEKSVEKTATIGFLGGFGDVAERVAKRQISLNPDLKVVLAEPGEPAIGYDSRLKSRISRVGRVDILFVAYGMGKQEFWIKRNISKQNVGIFIGVGGAFDYVSGEKIRAPRALQTIGLEWLWRLAVEPLRFWRMRVLPQFFILVLFHAVLGRLKNSAKM